MTMTLQRDIGVTKEMSMNIRAQATPIKRETLNLRIKADERAREQVHAAQMRTGGRERFLMIQPAQENQIFADRCQRLRGSSRGRG